MTAVAEKSSLLLHFRVRRIRPGRNRNTQRIEFLSMAVKKSPLADYLVN